MKKIFFSLLFFFFCFFFLSSCGHKKQENTSETDIVNFPATADKGIDKNDLPQVKFDEGLFDFGTITQGEKVSHDFKFKNIGNKELIISSASADCGCTVAEVPKNPIQPGEGNVIRVTFDSKDKQGIVTKNITVVTNAIPNSSVVKIKANIFIPQSKN